MKKFEQYAQDAHKFVREIAAELGEPDNTDQAERVLTAVLHTIREVLSPEESLHLIAQLPMMIKALYVNGWRLNRKNRIRSMDDFIECLLLQHPKTAPRDFGNDDKAKEKTRAVLAVIRQRVAVGEIKDIVDQFPSELTGLWLTEKEEHERYSL
jgi:uncharacterized protein (DUF2267 family)